MRQSLPLFLEGGPGRSRNFKLKERDGSVEHSVAVLEIAFLPPDLPAGSPGRRGETRRMLLRTPFSSNTYGRV